MIEVGNATILQGDCLEMLKQLPDESVQCCVTSPPYWGLRDYGHPGQIGLEPTPEEYVDRLRGVFREVRRALRADGTLWLNLGDSYTSGGRTSRDGDDKLGARAMDTRPATPSGLKPKDLVGIPWMVAFALRADGWYLRSDIIWAKPNPMPESVTDRPTKAHEYLFLLAKSERYYYNHEAVKEPGKDWGSRDRSESKHNTEGFRSAGQPPHRGLTCGDFSKGRNRRTVWDVATQPFDGAHFAVFPPKLIEPCILAGARAGDTVLDPFNGSGTTGIVALKHDRRYIGVELNPEYVALTVPRLQAEQQQMRLAL